MISVLFADDSNLLSINKFTTDLCNISGQNSQPFNVDSLLSKDCRHKSQILVLNKKNPDFNLQKALDVMATGSVIVMNSDETHYAGLKLTKPMRLITYGYNPKSTITASSIVVHENISLQCCIQRQFATLSGAILEVQEFLVRTNYMELTEGDILASVSVALLCDASIDRISNYTKP